MTPAIDWNQISAFLGYDPARPLLFNSAGFLLLFLLFYGIYLLLLRQFNLRILYTLAFSYYFYYKSSGFFFLLLLLSTLIDFTLGHFIFHARNRRQARLFLFLSIASNLGILAYFKYTNFFLESANSLFGTGFHLKDIFLPVGISFFTFQTMSYSIDIFRGKLVPVTEDIRDLPSFFRNLTDFAFFVSFFPQLVAGPIVRAAAFIPQIRQSPQLSESDMGRAFLLIMGGLFKKAVISDYISVNFVDRVFESPALYSGFENLMAVYGYAIQIYCDFSGYSDMAIGLAMLLGFTLPDNFNEPYRAADVQEFWQRWHISLSTWLRDYLYISLGGNRRGRSRTYVNLMITMLLGGLWHGASWVFILWGGLHGIALVIDRYLREQHPVFHNAPLRALFIWLWIHLSALLVIQTGYRLNHLSPDSYQQLMDANLWVGAFWIALVCLALLSDAIIGKVTDTRRQTAGHFAAVVLTFHFVCLCWVFFRSGAPNNPVPPMQSAAQVFTQLLTAFDASVIPQFIEAYGQILTLILLGFFLHYLPREWSAAIESHFIRSHWAIKSTALAFIAWLAIQTTSSDVVPFIYFQF